MLKKFFSKLNIIDYIIITGIIIIIASLAYRIISQHTNDTTAEYTVTVICNSCPEAVYNVLKTKPECFSFETQKPLGKISSVTKYDSGKLSIDIRTNASNTGHGILVNGTQILLGMHINLIAENSIFTVLVEDMHKSEDKTDEQD